MVFMENETKIFVAWLIKYVKKDKRITGRKLAQKIECDPTTISSYVRRRTKPDYETRSRILNALGISHDEMMSIGRSELSASIPTPTMTATATNTPPETSQIADISQKHHGIIDQFEDKERATRINEMLVQIEKIDDDELEEIQDLIAAKLKKLLRKSGGLKKTGTDGLPG